MKSGHAGTGASGKIRGGKRSSTNKRMKPRGSNLITPFTRGPSSEVRHANSTPIGISRKGRGPSRETFLGEIDPVFSSDRNGIGHVSFKMLSGSVKVQPKQKERHIRGRSRNKTVGLSSQFTSIDFRRNFVGGVRERKGKDQFGKAT